jgi:diacylglycerol kinase family enzyme
VRKAALIYNLASGAARERRLANVDAAAREFLKAGIEVQLTATTASGSAISQARELAQSGFDAVIACGGDGTVNEVAQGIVESGAEAALGVIPLGTANAVAAELGLSLDTRAAARQLLTAEPRRMAVGKLEFRDRKGTMRQRCWLAAASVGVDAELMYIISTLHKGRFGMAAYFAGGARLLLTHPFAPFKVEFTEADTGRQRQEVVAYFLLARVANFGKIFKGVAPGATLTRDDAALVLFKTRRRISYVRFATAVLLGRRWSIPGVESVQVRQLSAQAVTSAEVPAEWRLSLQNEPLLRAEVDGEVVGTLPVRSTVIPNALTLLFPRN